MHRSRGISKYIFTTAATAAVLCVYSGCSTGESVYDEMRARMVRDQIEGRGIDDGAVLEAMLSVPRHRFVPSRYTEFAYTDSPLPIGMEQTISQPYIVALMTASLCPRPGYRVLEIGTGSGYQAAVLSMLVDSVFTIEIIPELSSRSSSLLDSLGYGNVIVRTGDGFAGWPDKAPFDGIIVTAAAPRVPEPLIEQLKPGGRLVIPVGGYLQSLEVYTKTGKGLELLSSTPVRFVPMTGKIRERKGE